MRFIASLRKRALDFLVAGSIAALAYYAGVHNARNTSHQADSQVKINHSISSGALMHSIEGDICGYGRVRKIGIVNYFNGSGAELFFIDPTIPDVIAGYHETLPFNIYLQGFVRNPDLVFDLGGLKILLPLKTICDAFETEKDRYLLNSGRAI